MESTRTADIRNLQDQGGDPKAFAGSLASRWGVSRDEALTIIAQAGGSTRDVDPETLAQERLAKWRRESHTDAYRRWNHEED